MRLHSRRKWPRPGCAGQEFGDLASELGEDGALDSINPCCLPSLIWYSPTRPPGGCRAKTGSRSYLARGGHMWCRCMPTDDQRGQLGRPNRCIPWRGWGASGDGLLVQFQLHWRRATRYSALQAPLEVPG